jgi:hypothetical protein
MSTKRNSFKITGAFAAVALAIDTAKERALEKEKPAYKRLPKKVKIKMELEVTDVDDYVPNEEEEKLQLELQNFAQELLDENKSWDRRKVIQVQIYKLFDLVVASIFSSHNFQFRTLSFGNLFPSTRHSYRRQFQ